ncbi:MAG: ABC transporter permease subunit [Firmicutes bacterium]|nr:ABC transporter permease subunit [Bacillota bacterium]
MNGTLLRKELRETRWKLVLGTAVLAATAIFLPLSFNFLKDLISAIPPEQLERFGGMMPANIFNDYSLYLWSQWNAKNLAQIGTILAVLVGMNLIAGEISGQTAGFLLTRPISRRSVFLTKALTGMLILISMVWFSTIVMVITAHFTPYTVDAGRLLLTTVITTLGLLVLFSLTLLFSTLIDEPVKAAGATLLVILLLVFCGWIEPLRFLNIFYHMNGAQYFIGGTFPVVSTAIMCAAAVVLLAAGLRLFEKKEF